MGDIIATKVKSFFEYLLALNNLVGKVTRDYKDYEKSWHLNELNRLEGCYILEDCEEIDILLEIHRPEITKEDLLYPNPPKTLKEWVKGNYTDERSHITVVSQNKYLDDNGEEQIEEFSQDSIRVKSYQDWHREWKQWARYLSEKKFVQKLYSDFFEIIQQMEKEGEALEFLFGKGILVWKFTDEKDGIICAPLLTTKLELDLNADKGIIIARQVEQEITVENEMFSGIKLPNIQRLNMLKRDLKGVTITEDQTDFLTQFIHLINADGQYLERETEKMNPKSYPVIYGSEIFFLRRKNVRVLRNDLEQIIKGISDEQLEITESLRGIIGDNENKELNNSNTEQQGLILKSNDLYFPLESNEQQKEIINRIYRNYGVTVQGPPGTGKTHTIANLVSHFLTQGKKILITSQKESPLKVLKNKIPEEIRHLCVPVLGGGRESLQEIEQSIRVISEKLGELDSSRLEIEITRDLVSLDQSKRQEAKLKNLLRSYAEKEGTLLHYKGEKLFKYDVAKRLSETSNNYSWIQDNIMMNANFPLEDSDFEELWQLKTHLRPEELALLNHDLPIVDNHLKNSTAFRSFIEEGKKLEQYNPSGQQVIEQYRFEKNKSKLVLLLKEAKNILSCLSVLSNTKLKEMVEDCKAGGLRESRWQEFSTQMSDAIERLFKLHHTLVIHTIKLPNKPLNHIKEDIELVKERLKAGNKPGMIFFLTKGKRTKYLFETPVIDERPITNVGDLDTLQTHLEYEMRKAEVTRVFNGNMADIGIDGLDNSVQRFTHQLEERMKEIKIILNSITQIDAFKEKVIAYEIKNFDFYSSMDYQRLIDDLTLAIGYEDYSKWFNVYNLELKQLKEWATNYNNQIWDDFYKAFANKDAIKWEMLLKHLQELKHKKQSVIRFYQLISKMKITLPLTAKSLELSVGHEAAFPNDFLTSFENQKLQTWLDETKDMNVSKIKKEIEEEHIEQKRLIRNIVSKATWKNQIERITDGEKRALSAWKSYIKRFGKGSGKYAHVNLQGAREQMKTAQTAIPVWIMPVNQVLENFPITNEKFDVVIFDESSQCDLFSINVLLRGKKIIVVGDDEQISPQAIGTNLEDVHELVRRHLKDIPNGNLFDGNISLYEIAEQTFPKEGKLMLREHFRCVPEIIQFSNDLSYSGQMIPLRLPLEEEKIDPPVVAVKIEDGYNDEREKDINIPEAEQIVNDMVTMIDNPKYEDQTFGVIALQGNKQAKLLETKIRDFIGDKEFVKRRVICGNAYTLQGDERDIIFLSMVVAPGRNFMALTRPSFKQSFNVAASRAKNQMRLYHSIDLEQLNTTDLRYKLLSYCKNPTRINDIIENLEEKCESPFELDVLRMIVARGYRVTPQVKVGHYRIDFVVEGLRDRLAVECDGEKWHGPEKFEEDMQRQESLERAGWKFWRVRGREFYFNRRKAMESLWEMLETLGIKPNDHKNNTSIELNNEPTETNVTQTKLVVEKPNKCPVTDALRKKGLVTIDKREQGGRLWVIGGSELQTVLKPLQKDGIVFGFTPKGSKSTKNLPAWYLKAEALELI
ncbi:AAA domain-containing protein [Evansella sp. AB-P1]|uniref:AAA domain-containing protein n=1 Tax=Evansella sp. AB-P1 TaxID=3037653 RepID=UPI00241C9202|nr:AAA domain-containing protein [Evansella sp. AB-P1]MDG5789794.1 AAA domain-containing protein [Evansella sp. AB-P1]